MSAGRIVHAGYVLKLGRARKTWKRRYFVLRSVSGVSVLEYYAAKDGGMLKGEIPLTVDARLVVDARLTEDLAHDHCMMLVSAGRKLHFAADDASQQREWGRHLRAVGVAEAPDVAEASTGIGTGTSAGAPSPPPEAPLAQAPRSDVGNDRTSAGFSNMPPGERHTAVGGGGVGVRVSAPGVGSAAGSGSGGGGAAMSCNGDIGDSVVVSNAIGGATDPAAPRDPAFGQGQGGHGTVPPLGPAQQPGAAIMSSTSTGRRAEELLGSGTRAGAQRYTGRNIEEDGSSPNGHARNLRAVSAGSLSYVGTNFLDRFGVRRAQHHSTAGAATSAPISPAMNIADGENPVPLHVAETDVHSVALAKCSIRFANATRQATDTAAAALETRMDVLRDA